MFILFVLTWGIFEIGCWGGIAGRDIHGVRYAFLTRPQGWWMVLSFPQRDRIETPAENALEPSVLETWPSIQLIFAEAKNSYKQDAICIHIVHKHNV